MQEAFAFQCDISMSTDYTIKVDPAYIFKVDSRICRKTITSGIRQYV
jgi:hypothetical protein